MSGVWYTEIVLSGTDGWEGHADFLLDRLEPHSGTLGQTPEGLLSVRVANEADDAFAAVRDACGPVMEALLAAGLHGAVIRSTEVMTEAEMDAFLAG